MFKAPIINIIMQRPANRFIDAIDQAENKADVSAMSLNEGVNRSAISRDNSKQRVRARSNVKITHTKRGDISVDSYSSNQRPNFNAFHAVTQSISSRTDYSVKDTSYKQQVSEKSWKLMNKDFREIEQSRGEPTLFKTQQLGQVAGGQEVRRQELSNDRVVTQNISQELSGDKLPTFGIPMPPKVVPVDQSNNMSMGVVKDVESFMNKLGAKEIFKKDVKDPSGLYNDKFRYAYSISSERRNASRVKEDFQGDEMIEEDYREFVENGDSKIQSMNIDKEKSRVDGEASAFTPALQSNHVIKPTENSDRRLDTAPLTFKPEAPKVAMVNVSKMETDNSIDRTHDVRPTPGDSRTLPALRIAQPVIKAQEENSKGEISLPPIKIFSQERSNLEIGVKPSSNNMVSIDEFAKLEKSDDRPNYRLPSMKFDSKVYGSSSDLNKYFKADFKTNEPNQLLRIDQNSKIQLNRSVLEVLHSIHEPVKVLSVIGPYRSGKSFILNRFANKQRGFGIGNSTNPCTQGVWLWPQQESEDSTTLLIDTEGLFAYNRNESFDMVLFLVTAIISSTMIYNSFGVIDESAIERLFFLINFGQAFSGNVGGSLPNLVDLFPHFIWLLRDFSLELVDKATGAEISAKEYLEASLGIDGNKSGSQAKDKEVQRGLIKRTFRERSCSVLVRPLADEKQLSRIDDKDYIGLRAKFREQVEGFIAATRAKLCIKKIGGKICTGPVLVDLLINVVDSINAGRLPELQTLSERIAVQETKRTLKGIIVEYKARVEDVATRLPIEEKHLLNALYNIKIDAITKLYSLCQAKTDTAKRLLDRKVEKVDEGLLEANRKTTNERNDRLRADLRAEFAEFIRMLDAKDRTNIAIDIKYKVPYIIDAYVKGRVGTDENEDVKAFTFDIFTQSLRLIERTVDQLDADKQALTLEKSRLDQRCLAYEELLKTQKASSEQLYEESRAMYEDKLKMQNTMYRGNIQSLEAQVTELQTQNNSYIQAILKLEEEQFRKRVQSQNKVKTGTDLQGLLDEIRTITSEGVEDRVRILVDKETLMRVREHERQMTEIKRQCETDLKLVKTLYEKQLEETRAELTVLKHENQQNVLKLMKKDTEVKIMNEQLKNEQNNRKTQNEFSKVLVSVS